MTHSRPRLELERWSKVIMTHSLPPHCENKAGKKKGWERRGVYEHLNFVELWLTLGGYLGWDEGVPQLSLGQKARLICTPWVAILLFSIQRKSCVANLLVFLLWQGLCLWSSVCWWIENLINNSNFASSSGYPPVIPANATLILWVLPSQSEEEDALCHSKSIFLQFLD